MSSQDISKLAQIASKIRDHVIKMLIQAGSGHPGGSLSAIEILTALYFHKLRYDPRNPNWEDRDRFILSKGHAAPALYATLALAGFFPESELNTLRKLGSRLQGHPDSRRLPGIEISTGSLGNGLSVGVGLALGAKLSNRNYKVYVLLGDGELQEGQVWEAAMAASHYGLDNLIAIVDRNGLQLSGPTEQIMRLEPVSAKWRAFNWEVMEIDGLKIDQILKALEWGDTIRGKPKVIIAHTLKGRGVPFMEWSWRYHGKVEPDLLSKFLEGS